MRVISVLLILAGILIAFAWPIYQINHAGDEVKNLRVFDRTLGGWRGGWQDREIFLDEEDGPYRIRLQGKLASGVTGLPSTLPVFAELTGPQGLVFSSEYDFAVTEKVPGSGEVEERLSVSLPTFNVIYPGNHKLSVRMLTDNDISLMFIDAAIIGNAQEADYGNLPIGLGLFGVGTIAYLIQARRRKRKDKKKQKEKSFRWGRQ